MYVDTKKMPLGKLSKVQIAKGFEVKCSVRDWLCSSESGVLLISTDIRDVGRAQEVYGLCMLLKQA